VTPPLLILGTCSLLLAGVVAALGLSYRPEWAQLPPVQPPAFRVAAKSLAATGVLLIGFGGLGLGGLVLAAVALFAVRAARD
jgi:hypothetical protein